MEGNDDVASERNNLDVASLDLFGSLSGRVVTHSRGVSDWSRGPYWLSSIEHCFDDCQIT
jgi:hypothetical protein